METLEERSRAYRRLVSFVMMAAVVCRRALTQEFCGSLKFRLPGLNKEICKKWIGMTGLQLICQNGCRLVVRVTAVRGNNLRQNPALGNLKVFFDSGGLPGLHV